jgi:hypothetical protein
MNDRDIRKDRPAVPLVLWTILVVLGLTTEARAYVDPGTGSYILQMVIAGLLGSFFAIKLFGRRIKAFIQRRFSRGGSGPEDGPAGEDD